MGRVTAYKVFSPMDTPVYRPKATKNGVQP